MGVTSDCDKEHSTACRSAQSYHVAHVLVGVRRVKVVHIGHEDVVVTHLRCHFCRDFLYQEMFSLHTPSVTVDCVDCY